MIIGFPKEIKTQEYRVALLPSAAYQLIKRGHTSSSNARRGIGAGYPDAEYERAGAKILWTRTRPFSRRRP
jgi:alanine dehydrogenase